MDQRRAAAVAATAGWYSPVLHLLCTAGTGIAMAAIAASRLHDICAGAATATVLSTFLFANFFEWSVHKNFMHRPRRFMRQTYEDHTRRHHAIYTADGMEMQSRAEWRFVLIGAKDYVVIMLVSVITSCLAGLVAGGNIGWLALASQLSYVSIYELTHLAYHLPTGNIIRRLPLFAALSAHHTRHHDPGLMGKFNFNITVPLADYVLGTAVPADKADRRRS